jgi:hypothetical protein
MAVIWSSAEARSKRVHDRALASALVAIDTGRAHTFGKSLAEQEMALAVVYFAKPR